MDMIVNNIDVIVKGAAVIVCICAFFALYYFWISGLVSQIGNDGKVKIQNLVMQSLSGSSKSYNYTVIDMKLKQNGCKFYYPWLNPVTYVCLKATVALIAAIFGLASFSWVVAIMLGFVAWYLPDAVFSISDKSDNDAIVEDIMAIYDTLRLQTKAGIYLSTSLVECYTVIRNRRLKAAMLELTSEILAKNNIVDGIEDFTTKFQNQYIDSFGIIIKQGLESGQIVKILDDIGNQLKDLKHLMNEKEKKKVSNQILVCQMLVYVGVILLTAFVVLTGMDTNGLF